MCGEVGEDVDLAQVVEQLLCNEQVDGFECLSPLKLIGKVAGLGVLENTSDEIS